MAHRARAPSGDGQRVQTRRKHLVERWTVRLPVVCRAALPRRGALGGCGAADPTRDRAGRGAGHDLRRQSILLPSVKVLECLCADAITRATRHVDAVVNYTLSVEGGT